MFTAVTFLLAVAAAKTAEPPPAELVGTWEVAHVAVNMADQPHWKYRPEDPTLIGRELVLRTDQIRFTDFREYHCEPATWKRESGTWKQLVDDVFLGPTARTTPAEWRVKSAQKGKLAVHVPCGQSSTWRQPSWFLPVGPDRAILELDTETVLFLVRRKADAKPTPSFSCAKASTPTEKTICDSFVLAGWDRSVSLAWKRAQEFGYDSMDDQQSFLRTRDKCGGDAACLERAMAQRTQDLTYR
jgi:hypothetical protein